MAMARARARAAGRRRAVVLPLSALSAGMLDTVGGKAANLGELIGAGFTVPDGFVVTTEAYRAVAGPVDELIGRCDGAELAAGARGVLLAAEVPADVAAAIRDRYARLGEDVAVAVRSSATAEDLPYASFAGQQDTYLHVVGRGPGRRGGPPLLGVAVDRPRGRLPRHDRHRPRGGAARGGGAADGGRGRGRGAVHRQPGDRPAAAGGDRRQPRPGRGGGLRRGQPGPLRGRHRDRRVLERRLGDKRIAVRPTAGGGTHTVALPDGSAARA